MSWRVHGDDSTATCKVCGERKRLVSQAIGVCVECIRQEPEVSSP